MIIHYAPDIHLESNSITLTGDEALHCAKVLRKRIGDVIYITDGIGALHTCKIEEISKSACTSTIISSKNYPKRDYSLSIAICPTKKQSRIEWFVEKAVEIGVSKIIITRTQRTEKTRLKEDRIYKIAISAMKQSKNLHLPEIITNCSWSTLISRNDLGHRYIAHCEDPETHLAKVYPKGEDCVVAIGPEGDFTSNEIKDAIQSGWKEVNLGPSRLRTETAGIVVASVLAQINI